MNFPAKRSADSGKPVPVPTWNRGLRLGRRDFLALTAALPAFAMTGRMADAATQTGGHILDALVDTLVPGDADFPSGPEIGIPKRLFDLSKTIPNYPEMLGLGFRWIDETTRATHGKDFRAATRDQRDAILRAALNEPAQTLPAVFAARVRNDVMTLYYASPEVWAVLGFEGPIQPVGFPDHDKAPTA